MTQFFDAGKLADDLQALVSDAEGPVAGHRRTGRRKSL